MVAAKLGRGEEALGILRRVVQLQPDSAAAHSNLGMALAGDGFDLPAALEQFSEAIRLDQESATAHYNKGRVLNELNRPEEARLELDTACRLQPDYVEALYLLAQIEKQLGNIQRSVELLAHLVTLEPSNSDAQLLLGRNLVALGMTEDASHHLHLAVGANPNNEDALYSLAQAFSRMGKPEAKLYMDRFQELKQRREIDDRVQHLGSYGLEAANAQDWPQAVKDFTEAIELCGACPSSVDLHRNLGLIYVLKGDLAEGRRELQTALRIKPDDADSRKALESLSSKETTPH
jgi:tetratricopeptide (TPR) repeat protein